ncbi:MAG: hypothetical protein ACLR93_12765 [Alistipes onderdonkii]
MADDRAAPYGIIADPNDTPKAVFIPPSTPRRWPGLQLRAPQRAEESQAGIGDAPPHAGQSAPLGACQGRGRMPMLKCRAAHFAGKHPAGNVGIQIHHIDP